MANRSLNVSVAEAVCANTAMMRNLLVHLLRVGALSADELDVLFAATKKDLTGGYYDPATVEGAKAYLDSLRQNMAVKRILPTPDVTH